MSDDKIKTSPQDDSAEKIREDAKHYGRADACRRHPVRTAYAELYDECIFDL